MTKPAAPTPTSHAHRRRFGRAQQDPVQDTYRLRAKPAEPTVCPQCRAVFREGRWRWGERPAGAHEEKCPACHRISDQHPAGLVTLHGGFVAMHEAEIRSLLRHQEEAEKREHPLNRIMTIEREGDALVVKTTDIHLPRRIGDALQHAFHGKLDTHYDEQGYFVRINWRRES